MSAISDIEVSIAHDINIAFYTRMVCCIISEAVDQWQQFFEEEESSVCCAFWDCCFLVAVVKTITVKLAMWVTVNWKAMFQTVNAISTQ